MANYSLYIFLMSRSSVERVAGMLANANFTVRPNLTNDRLSYTGDGGVSTLMCMSVDHAESTRDKVHEIISSLLKNNEVPYYGFVLSSSDGGAKFNCGYFPPVKEKIKPIPQGPYRTNVIPFGPKDDGIIDE